MRYGPNSAEVEAFLAWLERLDADEVRVVLDNAPLAPEPDRQAAIDSAFASGLSADVASALDKDQGPAFLALTEREVFADRYDKNHFWTTVGITLRAIANRAKLAPADVELLLEPFRAAGFASATTTPEETR